MTQPLTIDASEFQRQFEQLVRYSLRDARTEFLDQVALLMRHVADITPPAHGKGTRGKARKMGRNKIAGDLVGKSGTRRTRRAGIFTVLSDGLIDSAMESGLYENGDTVRLWVTGDGRVYGTQQHFFRPDATMGEMKAHHDQFFQNGEMSRAGTFTRDIGRWKWIDQMVVRESTFEKYLKREQRNVGYYAAGFRPTLQKLGLPIPSYMKGHAAKGYFHLTFDEGMMTFEGVNQSGYPSIDKDLQRRINWAIGVRANAIERRLPHVIRHYEKTVN